MRLEALSCMGKGSNSISAFDDALRECGLENYNLIGLSSIIPPGSEIVEVEEFKRPEEMGNRLYLVYSKNVSKEKCSAGIGWLYGEEGGILVEHTGETESDVREKIDDSLTEMRQYRDIEFEGRGEKIVSAESSEETSCAFVAVVFEEKSWNSDN